MLHLDLRLPASRTVRKSCVLSELSGPCYLSQQPELTSTPGQRGRPKGFSLGRLVTSARCQGEMSGEDLELGAGGRLGPQTSHASWMRFMGPHTGLLPGEQNGRTGEAHQACSGQALPGLVSRPSHLAVGVPGPAAGPAPQPGLGSLQGQGRTGPRGQVCAGPAMTASLAPANRRPL